MLRKARKFGAMLMALTMIFVLSLGAGAAYYNTPTAANIDGKVIGTITDDAITASYEIVPGGAMSVNFMLSGDALTSEFWNQSDAYVEVDVTMNTDGDQVFACLPGFTSSWGWVNPTDWNGLLSKGKTITVREPFSTYYSGGFNKENPQLIRVQLYTNSTETQNVEVTVSSLRFVGVGDVAEVTTTVATTTTAAPEETTTVPEDTEAPVEDEQPAETVDAQETVEEDEPEEVTTTTTAATTAEPEEDDTDRPITTTTQPNQTTTPAATTTAATTVAADSDGGSFAGPIIIIIIAVAVIAAAAVGFIIYRKKKFY